MRKFLFLAALTALVVSPGMAMTVSSTASCTSAESGTLHLIDFNGGFSDPGGYASVTSGTVGLNAGSNPGCSGDFAGLSSSAFTISFSSPVDYVGFAWGSPDGYNSALFYDGATLLGSYTGGDVTDLFMNFSAGLGEQITSVAFSSGSCCYEIDNLTYRVADTAAPEPGTMMAPVLAGAVLYVLRRRYSVVQ